MINNIKINVAYDKIVVYDKNTKPLYGVTVLENYDIYPEYVLNWNKLEEIEKKYNIKFPYHITGHESEKQINKIHAFYGLNIENVLDNSLQTFTTYSLNEIYETNKNFIYAFVLYNNDIFTKYSTMDFDPRLIECVKNKRAKICFIQPTEGFFGTSLIDYQWMSNLSKKFGFDKQDLLFITSNMIAHETYKKYISEDKVLDNFIVWPYSYFQHTLWFYNYAKLLNNDTIQSIKEKFHDFIVLNNAIPKKRHFLCFNRVMKQHRIAMFGELMSNPKLRNKSIATLGGDKNYEPDHFYKVIQNVISSNYKYSKQKLLDYFKQIDATKHITYDVSDLENNKAGNLNIDAHTTTFVNIVTESLFQNNDTVFFSEKTFKPIFCAQPFIIFGNPHSLKTLKDYGFKTFDRWWDESYDNETDFTKKLEKIVDVLEEIGSWSMEKCFQITKEMEETLIHNFNVMIDDSETVKLYEFLSFDNRSIPKKFIKNKKKKLGICGDSFMASVSYDSKNKDNGFNCHFSELLANMIDWDVITYAKGGCSNQAIRLQIDEIINDRPDYVIIGTTTADRIEIPIEDQFKNKYLDKFININDVYSYDHKNGIYNIKYNDSYSKSSENENFHQIKPTMMSVTLSNVFEDTKFQNISRYETRILEMWFERFYDSAWKTQQDTWIIANGLKKLSDNEIKYSCIINFLLRDEFSSFQQNILYYESDLNPWKYVATDNMKYPFHTSLEGQEILSQKWFNYLIKIGILTGMQPIKVKEGTINIKKTKFI